MLVFPLSLILGLFWRLEFSRVNLMTLCLGKFDTCSRLQNAGTQNDLGKEEVCGSRFLSTGGSCSNFRLLLKVAGSCTTGRAAGRD